MTGRTAQIHTHAAGAVSDPLRAELERHDLLAALRRGQINELEAARRLSIENLPLRVSELRARGHDIVASRSTRIEPSGRRYEVFNFTLGGLK